MRRNWAATVLVVSVSVLCAPALAGPARPPLFASALSPGALAMTTESIHPFEPPCIGRSLIEDAASPLEITKSSETFYAHPRPESRKFREAAYLRERVRVAHTLGRFQLGGLALRRPRPGQVGRPTEVLGGQDIHVRAGISYRLAPHFDLISDLLYIQPAVQSLYVRQVRAPLQAGVGTRITTSKASILFSLGAGMSQWGGPLRPGLFLFFAPGSV